MDIVAAAVRVGVRAGVHSTKDPELMPVEGGSVVGPCRGFAIHLPMECINCTRDGSMVQKNIAAIGTS